MSRKRRRRRNKIHPNTPLTITPRFGEALERYMIGCIKNLPVQWEWVGVGLAALILGASLAAGYFRPSQLSGTPDVTIKTALAAGDYTTARWVYENSHLNPMVLGAQSDIEDQLYPERRLSREIEILEKMTTDYPNSRDLLLALSRLYQAMGDNEKAQDARENARILDPNNEIFK